MKAPAILETTLRDGSYAINFQFTAADTALMAGELERLGFDLIEIGHGIGLGASETGKGKAAETDEGYLKAAAETLKRARWGMFCIPGIARLDHIDMAAQFGMRFIRIGTNVTDVESSASFIARAKKHGMYVSANFMKSYATPPVEFAKMACTSVGFGSDVVYVVDSAGGMLPEEMEGYFRAVRDVSDVPLGFHGHDNMGLAVANSLHAVDLGAAIIDTSLQGLGRSAGNTPTEVFLVALYRKGFSMGIEPLAVMDMGEKYVRPLLGQPGRDSVDIVSGFAQFHSSYMGIVREYAAKYRVDPRRLIVALCEKDRVNAPRALVESIARTLSQEGESVFTARLAKYHGNEQDSEI